MLPQLRDYTAAPFLLIALAAIATVIWRSLRPKQLIILAGFVGLELGIGFGFRTDMAAALPPFLAVMVLTGPLRSLRSWKIKGLAAFICVATFAIASIGVLPAYLSGGTNSPLVTLEGSTTPFTTLLSLTPQALYDSGYEYNDDYTLGLINAYSHLIENRHTDIQFATRSDDATASSYLDSLVRETPGDFVARGFAATAATLELGPESFRSFRTLPTGVADPTKHEPPVLATSASSLRTALGFLHYLPWSFAIVPGLAALILLWRNRFRGLLWILVVIYFGALNAIQYGPRHNFYLEPLWWLSCAIVIESTVKASIVYWRAGSLRLRQALARKNLRRAASVAGTVAILGVVATGGLSVARLRQNDILGNLFSSYQKSPRTELKFTRTDLGDGQVLMTPSPAQEIWRGGTEYKEAFLAATFGGPNCAPDRLTVALKYRAETSVSGWPPYSRNVSYDNFSEKVPLVFNITNPFVTKYFVALSTPYSHFSGIEIPANQAGCLYSLSVIRNTSNLPILLDTTLPTHWESVRRFQAFRFEPSAPLFKAPVQKYGDTDVLIPSNLNTNDLSWRPVPGVLGKVRRANTGWNYNGSQTTPFSYIETTGDINLIAGSKLVMIGDLRSGSITFELQHDKASVTTAGIISRGRFAAVLVVPRSATYTVSAEAMGTGQIGFDISKSAILPP